MANIFGGIQGAQAAGAASAKAAEAAKALADAQNALAAAQASGTATAKELAALSKKAENAQKSLAAAEMTAVASVASAVIAVVQMIKEAVVGALNTVKEFGQKMQGIVKSTVEAFRPQEIINFNMAVLDLKAVFGEMFVPIMREATAVVRSIADWFVNLSNGSKNTIADFAKLSIVLGVLAGATLAIAAAISAIVLIMGTAAAPILLLIGVFIAISSAAGYIANKMGIFKAGLGLLDRAISFVVTGLQMAWSSLAPIRDALSSAFDELRAAFMELYAAFEPIIALVGGALVVAFRIVVGVILFVVPTIINAITILVKVVTFLVNNLLNSIGLSGLKLPKMPGDKSSFGMGQHSVEVGTDLSGLKTKMEQQIIARQSGKDSMEETAENTKQCAGLLQQVADKIGAPSSVRAAASVAVNTVGGPAVSAIRSIFGI